MKQTTNKIFTLILLIVFFIGLSVLLYPALSQYWNSKVQSKAVTDYDKMIQSMSEEDYSVELEKAYKTENLPINCPQKTADERMQEIKKFRISYEESSKKYIELTNEKLSFKDFITEDYRNKEEYQNKSTEQLQQIQKEKLGEQNEIIDNIIVDTKKGTQIAKNIHHEIGEQNKVIGQIGQDMEMVDSRMNKLTKRFNEYTKKSSTCCLCVFFWCDAIVFGLLVWIYTCVNESGWHC